MQSVAEPAQREWLDRRSVRRLLPLGFLSPKVVEMIVAGRQPLDLTVFVYTLRLTSKPFSDWVAVADDANAIEPWTHRYDAPLRPPQVLDESKRTATSQRAFVTF